MKPAPACIFAMLGLAAGLPASAQVAANINANTGPVFPTRAAVMSGGRWNFSLSPRQPVLAHPMGGPARGPNYAAAERNALGLVTVAPVPVARAAGAPVQPPVVFQPPPIAPRPAVQAPAPGSKLPPLEQVFAPPPAAKLPATPTDAVVRRVVEMQKARAAEGSPAAQFDLGVRYMKADGVLMDLELARRWLTESALNGHSPAARKLAELDALPR